MLCFLPKIFRDRNAADGFLDGGVDICRGFHAAFGHEASQRAKARRHAKDDWHERDQKQ